MSTKDHFGRNIPLRLLKSELNCVGPSPPLALLKLQNSPPAIGLIVHLHFAKGKKLRTKSLGQQNTTF